MSDVQNTTALHTEATEPAATATTEQPEVSPTESSPPVTDVKPVVNDEPAMETQELAAAPVEAKKDEVAPTVPEKAVERSIEPISEGQLAVKGPGLIKQIVPSKKEFWLSDSPVTPQHMDLYMRGEKAEISHPVVAWASQTGKGLLFFNKKGETERTHPHSVLPLYDAMDLKKAHPHEITFRLHGEQHTLKAANDTERDGWFISLERAVEVGKVEKESIGGSEGYKAEMEKLNKPNTMHAGGVVGAAAAARSKSHPKSTDEPRRAGSDADDAADKQKSRSTSRGVLGKLKGKKDGMEAKREVKHEGKQEKKAEKEETKAEKEAEKSGEAAPAVPLAGGTAFNAPSTAERALGAPVEEPVAESTPVTDGVAKTEEKPKASKRGSIFGRMQSGFSSMKSPVKEKDQKDAELKPQVPPKDAGVSETAPQIPEPAAEPAAHSPSPVDPVAADKPAESAESTTNGKPAEAVKEKLDELPPKSDKKSSFLSGLPFMNKRDRSVSPSANMKDAPVKQEAAPAVPPKEDGVAAIEPAAEEPTAPVHETPAVEPANETLAAKAEEPSTAAATDATSPPSNKRQSVLGNFGNLGGRASKAFKGMQTPKKENAAPAVAPKTKTEEPKGAAPAVQEPVVNGESKPAEAGQQDSIGDVNPDSIYIGQAQTTPTVTASA